MTNAEKLERLLAELNALTARQDGISMELQQLRREINILKLQEQSSVKPVQPPKSPVTTERTVEQPVIPPTSTPELAKHETMASVYNKHKEGKEAVSARTFQRDSSGLEKFIGENLVNKIGIAITVIGVAIGAKYSIDHELISPLTRIILGYAVGLGLLAFGIKLKKNYENYSSVLVSGAIAVMYFMTFAAYSFYGLLPQALAFALMTIFTAFGVVAAIHYNKQVIAHIGLIGAYAVPFLLSDGSGKVLILFTYIALINTGILVIAYRKLWKPLFYASFILTWVIYISWHISKYDEQLHYELALVFAFVFFITFYIMLLINQLARGIKYDVGDIIMLFFNAFVFYASGYAILVTNDTGEQLLGLFTALNAIIHFVASVVVYKSKLADRNIFYLVSGLVLTFITIAIPVQLDGNWVTLLWMAEATVLFWVGRTRNVPVYEKLSYPLIVLGVLSLMHDWMDGYDPYGSSIVGNPTPLFNVTFLSSVLVIAFLAVINYLYNHEKYKVTILTGLQSFMRIAIPSVLILIIYMSFRNEISFYWEQHYYRSMIPVKQSGGYIEQTYNEDLRLFKSIWLLNYTFVFLALLALINVKKVRSELLGIVNICASLFFLFIFLTAGLVTLWQLNESFISNSQYYNRGSIYLLLRYIAIGCAVLNLFVMYYYLRKTTLMPQRQKWYPVFEIVMHVVILAIFSNEMLTLMSLNNIENSDRLGLSILCGVYALGMISYGIWKRKKHIRIAAIVLFGVTLIKLFIYDIAELDTIAKTIVFVALGILLLIISFLYNKYKKLISDQ